MIEQDTGFPEAKFKDSCKLPDVGARNHHVHDFTASVFASARTAQDQVSRHPSMKGLMTLFWERKSQFFKTIALSVSTNL